MRIKLLTTVYFLIAFIEIYIGVWMKNPLVEAITKPMLMLILISLYWVSVQKKDYWYILALAFSFLGDVFLLDKSNMFLFGVGAFLLTQLIYIKLITNKLEGVSFKNVILSILPFALYLTGLLYLLYDKLGSFRIPVIVYGITISVFGMVSLLSLLEKRDSVRFLMFAGAVVFILSDSMIALNKFYRSEEIYPVAIMMTYVLAQYLIYRSVISEAQTSG